MHRFFVSPEDVYDKYIFITDSADIKHLTKVLRMKEGDIVEVSDSEKWEYTCRIDEIGCSDGIESSKAKSGAGPDRIDEIRLVIEDKQAFAREPELKVTLFQGVPKQGKMETIVQKCVELGVSEIVPVFMKRSVVVDNGKFSKKIQRWQKVSDEAVKQCKRGIIPAVSEQLDFNAMAARLESGEFDLIVFPYEGEDGYNIKDLLRESRNPHKAALIIGPEGGFAESEVRRLEELGIKPVSLGRTILRTETAGMAALAMIMYELEL